ncbi:MAG: hypothetical protein NVSMB67_30450 [Flavisolibacter sp.]
MKKIILVIVFILVAVVGWYVYHEFNRKNKDLTYSVADFQFSADQLIHEFEKDAVAANKTYINKIVAVNGLLQKIDAEGNPVIFFLVGNEKMSSIKCSMDSSYLKDYKQIKPGIKITVKGVCTGGDKQDFFGTDITLNYCVIDNNFNLK